MSEPDFDLRTVRRNRQPFHVPGRSGTEHYEGWPWAGCLRQASLGKPLCGWESQLRGHTGKQRRNSTAGGNRDLGLVTCYLQASVSPPGKWAHHSGLTGKCDETHIGPLRAAPSLCLSSGCPCARLSWGCAPRGLPPWLWDKESERRRVSGPERLQEG